MRSAVRAGADEYVPGHGDLGFHVEHYDLELTYKVRGNHLVGIATLYVEALESLSTLSLDLHGLRVAKVSLDGSATKYTHRRDRLTIRPAERIKRGRRLRLVVHYTGSPGPLTKRHLGSAGWEELDDGSIVAAQPHGAPTWFPCNDRPSDKASYRITVTAPSEYEVVSNGWLSAKKRHASATTWRYEQREPMATYLATVHVGRYRVLELDAPVPLRAVLPARLVHKYDEAFEAQPAMLDAFSRMFGRYPFAAYTVVITDDELEIPLESQGLSTFGSNFLKPDWDAVRLVAHELAHQWFGNSLTLGHWRDIWLHEGFACYAEWLWSEESGGKTAHQQATEHWARLAELDQDVELADPGPDLMFDDRVYKRGALLLHALRLTVGDEAFFDLLRAWTATFALGTVSTALFTELAERQTGCALGELFRAWLLELPLPELPESRPGVRAG